MSETKRWGKQLLVPFEAYDSEDRDRLTGVLIATTAQFARDDGATPIDGAGEVKYLDPRVDLADPAFHDGVDAVHAYVTISVH